MIKGLESSTVAQSVVSYDVPPTKASVPDAEAEIASKLTLQTARPAEPVIQADEQSIDATIEEINVNLLSKSTNLVFEFDKMGDPPVVKVVDKSSGDVIREIPSKELRVVAKALNELADKLNGRSGILLDEQS